MALMAVLRSSSLENASRLVFWLKKNRNNKPTTVATIISSITVKPFFISFIIAYFVI